MIDHMKQNRLTLVESPTGSGKTNIMLSYAAFVRQHKKVIVITPQLGINHNFTKYTKDGDWCAVERDKDGNEIAQYSLSYNSIKESHIQKSASMKLFLSSAKGTIRVSSYKAFDLALDDETIDMSDVVLLVDEVHHSDMKDENLLGSILRKCVDRCSEVHAFTATDFRSDGGQPTSEEFSRFRRLLKEHYQDGCCPDFGVFLRFYHAVSKSDFDQLAVTEDISDKPDLLNAVNYPELLKAYVDEYKKSPLPTIMYVDGAKQAFELQKVLLRKCKGIRTLNFGSDDGERLVSDVKNLRKTKLDALTDAPRDYDVVIAIKLFDEGMDWVECAQTFNPRLTGSLQRFIQRCVGRALRHKTNPKHPSPDLSRVVIFEVTLDDKDQDVVKNANLQVAIRIKAICSGIDFTDTFMLAVPLRRRAEVDKEREQFKLQINSLQNNEILQRILWKSAAGASANELIAMFCKQCAKYGTAITPITAINLLMQYDVIDKNDRIALEEIIRKRDRRLSKLSFSEFMNDPEVKEAIKKLKVIGITDYFGIINGIDDMDEVERVLIRFNANSARENKRKLIELAKSGGKKPNAGSRDVDERKIGKVLCHYTTTKDASYDAAFDNQIHHTRPDWFENTSDINKAKLIESAKSGAERPSSTSKNPDERKLGGRLLNYISSNRKSYDPVFRRQIRALRPDWFEDTVATNKAKLIELAKSGADRPNACSEDLDERRLGDQLCRYIGKRNGDSAFRHQIRTLRPDWFEDTAAANKAKLIELAKSGADRPNCSSEDRETKRLGSILVCYTSDRSRDPIFNKQIRTLRPDWFEDTAATSKAKLIELAKSGADRPSSTSKILVEKSLGIKLKHYANKNSDSFDPAFNIQIRALRPDWFEDTAATSKAKLIELAKSGADRPSQSTEKQEDEIKLSRSLSCYTNEKNGSFDLIFNAKIRKLRPDWFEDTVVINKAKLIELAKGGAGRPNGTSKDRYEKKLGRALVCYTNESSNTFDIVFNKQIRMLRPDWFIRGNKRKCSRRGKYAGRNEYREFLVKALKYYSLTSFSDCEFWTLGGKEWYEYKHLVDAGIELGPNSYHNVDKEIIDKAPDGACTHSNREFLTIHKLWNRWKNPRVISYDATMGMVENRTEYWQELCYLAIAAAKKSGCVLFLWNFMEGYTHSSYKPIQKGVYKKWLQSLKGFAESEGLEIDFYEDGQITKRPSSQTPMLAGCCKITKDCLVSKAS
jgi:superfamily II DNA or RNA helicase